MIGRLAIVLHAHLPFVRHPEHERFLEESWLFEAVAESYLPLLRIMAGWERDGVDWRLTISLTPTLCSMLDDPLLRSRVRRYLEERIELAGLECERTLLDPARNEVADFYRLFYGRALQDWDSFGGDLVAAFGALSQSGRLEILGCAATHALLPLLVDEPGSLRAQIELGCLEHERRFGLRPSGFWLPECAWTPALEEPLHASGIRCFVLESHGLMRATPRPPAAVFMPVITPRGLAAFGRDPASARQVWSRQGGYPGDPRYREFHQDLAHDADWEYIRPYLPGGDVRVFTGIKYNRVTGGGGEKAVYERHAALQAVQEHAVHFLAARAQQIERASAFTGRPPLIVAPYDAELFGHWWFEGPEFLDAVMRGAASNGIRPTTLAGYLQEFPLNPSATPATSSWGDGGQLRVWLHESNARMQPELRRAGARMMEIARHASAAGASSDSHELACAAARELLLAQASDWPFLVRMGTAKDYANQRFNSHIACFKALGAAVSEDLEKCSPVVGRAALDPVIFPQIDPGCWLRPAC